MAKTYDVTDPQSSADADRQAMLALLASAPTTQPVGTPQLPAAATPPPPAVPEGTPSAPGSDVSYAPGYSAQGGPETAAAATSGPPSLDLKDPSTYDPWITYYFKIGNHGATPTEADLQYWRGKLTSGEITGTGQPATPDYWATRLMRQGVDDLNPPRSSGSGFTLPLTNGLANASALSGLNLGVGPSLIPTDTDAYQTLLQQIKDILGGDSTFDRTALFNLTAPRASSGGIGTTPPSVAPAPTNPYAPAAQTPASANPATATPVPEPTPAPPAEPSTPGAPGDKGADNAAGRSLLGDPTLANFWSRPAGSYADQHATTVPDRVGDAMLGLFPGMLPIVKAGSQLSKLNKPDQTPTGWPSQGPTNPNLKPLDPFQNAWNASVAANALGNNEASGGI